MARKKFIGKFVSFKIAGWKNPIRGILIDYNDEWTLLAYSPDEYLIDGFILLKNKVITGYERGSREKFAEKIFFLKGINIFEPPKIPLSDVYSILSSVSEKYGVFALNRKWEDEFYLGKVMSFEKGVITYDFLDPRAKWLGATPVKANEIRTIRFDTDYNNSLLLVENTKNKKRTAK